MLFFLQRDENAPKKIEDANAKKPDGWLDDEPELIPDPQAVRPEDWWVESSRWSPTFASRILLLEF